jgi:hypothetical protein
LLIKYEDIVRYVKAQRIRLIGHIEIMNEERTVERITDWKPITVRIGRLRLRWEGDVSEDLGKTKIQN